MTNYNKNKKTVRKTILAFACLTILTGTGFAALPGAGQASAAAPSSATTSYSSLPNGFLNGFDWASLAGLTGGADTANTADVSNTTNNTNTANTSDTTDTSGMTDTTDAANVADASASQSNAGYGTDATDAQTSADFTDASASADATLQAASTSSRKADKIVAFSQSLKGKVTYKFNANIPSKLIFDCSSFTKYVFGKYGVSLKWGTKYQKNAGTYVSKSNLKKGDLIFFSSPSGKSKKISHVGIYMGNGKFIHDTIGRHFNGIAINNLSDYTKRYVTARRVL